jgi:7,8-dihydropterin-6-yl-methyl-4-(beta-D-ribofuranosyl)aminobenzene 5'-phosphate synthase
LIPDTLEDDQSLWIETEQGLVIVLGCAHAGVVNTVGYIVEKSGREDVRAVIGGMHLMGSDLETIRMTADALALFNPGLISPNHCTGHEACAYFRDRLPDSYRPSGAGTVFTFPG